MIKTQNPFTEEVLSEYPYHSDKEIEIKISESLLAHKQWHNLSIEKRLNSLTRLSEKLEDKKDFFAKLMTNEMGKPYKQAVSEVEKCIRLCDYYKQNATTFLAPENISSDHQKSFVRFEPLGLVLSIMPWNFPLWQVFRFIVPSILVGNSSLLKHASNVSGTALALESLFVESIEVKNIFQTLIISGEKANQLIAHQDISAVTFTGSTKVGRRVAKSAGENLKKAVLELGGSDAYIVLADADIKDAAEKSLKSRLINSGQSCIAAKRFIVCKDVVDEFTQQVLDLVKKQQVGNPMDSDIGPLAKKDFVGDIEKQKQDAIDKGAKLLYQSKTPKQGYFCPIYVLSDCTEDMKVFKEETFGPLICIFSANSEDEAVAMANNSNFGLGAAIFSKDKIKAEALAGKSIHAGTVAVNDFVKSDPRLPFGGIKDSGIGRELSHYGLKEFVNIKTITVD